MTTLAGTRRLSPVLTIAIVAALLAVTALLFTVRGTGDMGIWERWTNNALRAGVVDGFRENDNDYPPLSNVILWATGHVATAAGFPLPAAIKISLLIFLAATLVLFYAWTNRAGPTLALWAAFALNVIGMGYLDIYAMPPLVLSLWALQQSRFTAAMFWFCASCLIKWQPAIIGPFLLLHAVLSLGPMERSRWRSYLGLIGPALILATITTLVFQPYPMFRAFGKSLGHRILSGDTLNLAWIATWLLQSLAKGWEGLTGQVSAIASAPLGWRILFKAVFAWQFLILLVRFARGPMQFDRTLAYSCVGFLAYVTLSSGVHENHWFLPSFLAIVLAIRQRGWTAPAIAVCAIANINLWLFYGITGRGLEVSRVVGMDASVPLAAIVVAIYIWIWRRLTRQDLAGWIEPPHASRDTTAS